MTPSDEELFLAAPELVPPIGGILELGQPHSEHLLPLEVLLYEPEPAEIFSCRGRGQRGARHIFLNTPLTNAESGSLGELRRLLARRGHLPAASAPLPRYMETHALRMLQTCKFDPAKTADMMQTCLRERVARLPIREADVLEDLRRGFLYWHGRDRRCRPCLVMRLERLGGLIRYPERAVRLVMFTLEYALRFAMVPGRVENWVIIIDLANLCAAVSPLHMRSLVATAAAISTALEKVHCGRLGWVKIVNMPTLLAGLVGGLVPPEKKDKTSFPLNVATELQQHFEPNQLERRYGGTAPDLAPGETYPFRFFPQATGRSSSCAEEEGAGSLHDRASLACHEGSLWDDSYPAARARWLATVPRASLTRAAAAALLEQRPSMPVAPCQNIARWLELQG